MVRAGLGAGASAPVDAGRYDAFWLWAGVRPQPVLARARRIYLLAAQVTATAPARLQAQRPAPPRVSGAKVWPVVRVETLLWPEVAHAQVAGMLDRWRLAGSSLEGLQVDFDARTRHLDQYARFLQDLRRRLPPALRLGVTGLLDWSSHGDPAALNALGATVDEVVLQIYQGRHVIPGYADHLRRAGRLRTPFRVGLLQGGDYVAPAGLERLPMFRGYVVFLRN